MKTDVKMSNYVMKVVKNATQIIFILHPPAESS